MIWPPQNTGIFELKMPCCSCAAASLFGWGYNQNGELGLGPPTATERDSPTGVGVKSWLKIAMTTSSAIGLYCSLGIQSDNTLWASGDNTFGQLGFGNTTPTDTHLQVGSDTNWVSVTCGAISSFAIKSDGTLWAWGYNSGGELGLGDTTNRSSPTQIGSGTNWAFVSSGAFHTLAIKTDGTLWAWGDNTIGELGLGDNTNRDHPVQVGVGTNWATVACGTDHTLAVKTDGTLWAAGNNAWGQLGIGNTTSHNTFVQIGSATNWLSVGGGGDNHSLALKTDGSLYSWGINFSGQLGIGSADFTPHTSPIHIGSAVWSYVRCSAASSFAIKNDGTLWACGDNGVGELGLGNNTSPIATFTQAGADTGWMLVECAVGSSMGVQT